MNEPKLPERDPSIPAEQQGMFRKFEVYRTDRSDAGPGCKHYGCDYFVLDTTHDQHAKAALAAYADAAQGTHPELAADMRKRYSLAAVEAAQPEAVGDGVEIIRNLIDNIEADGMYSQESTLGFLMQAYSFLRPANQPAAPTATEPSDAERRDAARYRWLTSNDRRVTWIWNHALTDEDRADHLNFDAVCDAAIHATKGGKL